MRNESANNRHKVVTSDSGKQPNRIRMWADLTHARSEAAEGAVGISVGRAFLAEGAKHPKGLQAGRSLVKCWRDCWRLADGQGVS